MSYRRFRGFLPLFIRSCVLDQHLDLLQRSFQQPDVELPGCPHQGVFQPLAFGIGRLAPAQEIEQLPDWHVARRADRPGGVDGPAPTDRGLLKASKSGTDVLMLDW